MKERELNNVLLANRILKVKLININKLAAPYLNSRIIF